MACRLAFIHLQMRRCQAESRPLRYACEARSPADCCARDNRCIETMLCQLPGSNLKKSKQWKDFERDWNILMHHVFTKEEEELLANCCGPGQHEAVSTCVKGSNFTRKEYIQLRVSVVAWRHNK
ncbi:hypothetical protein MRX96_041389, partial [Rhipicephalus microplus]